MSPLEYYQKKLASGEILEDAQQASIMAHLQTIYEQIIEQATPKSLFDVFRKKKRIIGLYLWGSVGVGKTFLIDTFYYALPIREKQRLHFHKFMQFIHHELARLQGQINPVSIIAKEYAKKVKVLCLDELLVDNIVDAMVLARLFKALFTEGVIIFFTANAQPDELYKNGLQREQFIPAIKLIKDNCEIIEVSIRHDYRTNLTATKKFYYSPITSDALSQLEQYFIFYSNSAEVKTNPLTINDRPIKIKKRADGVIWFDFLDLCDIPRSKDDFIAIAEQFHTVIITNLFAISAKKNDLINSFIKLIDVLYDMRIRLIIAASHPIAAIYTEGRMLKDFARIRSRLTQMQSAEWKG